MTPTGGYCQLCGSKAELLRKTTNGGRVYLACEVCWSEYDNDARSLSMTPGSSDAAERLPETADETRQALEGK
jgi:formate dehydrogenase maturation protein FdhE